MTEWQLIGTFQPAAKWKLSQPSSSEWFRFDQVGAPDDIPVQISQESNGLFYIDQRDLRSGFSQALYLPSPGPFPSSRRIALKTRHKDSIPTNWLIRVFAFDGVIPNLGSIDSGWLVPGSHFDGGVLA